ncbi:MAG: hypothetical protein A3I12_04700 [Gammaproteobacteria bacterium RIFCSPLOWO2_02_FULL_38_11]|nr:MAG: hypothetical protein A3B69_01800 [Gammaproteobacteria bacterium RIFCSPHIGHO2_02_FULL_38_33]OGT23593.1 MAG: hypothetical protein A2W47_03130 [Gammaproteobacteria bacterium RIFCSPHIGHO2_12_38_15]OGT68146.1 MAG: hypothetical protein A3I12_04700 [Gammaproteobacteria bacterium RIFCSPLOWO2_02_FULL_38_11]OGT77838.1 MAG: hypothetical protein A3G71_03600 [Gammaproteobacteria bacterium RIFCSPLOWO2_12_FULL_38_14]
MKPSEDPSRSGKIKNFFLSILDFLKTLFCCFCCEKKNKVLPAPTQQTRVMNLSASSSSLSTSSDKEEVVSIPSLKPDARPPVGPAVLDLQRSSSRYPRVLPRPSFRRATEPVVRFYGEQTDGRRVVRWGMTRQQSVEIDDAREVSSVYSADSADFALSLPGTTGTPTRSRRPSIMSEPVRVRRYGSGFP